MLVCMRGFSYNVYLLSPLATDKQIVTQVITNGPPLCIVLCGTVPYFGSVCVCLYVQVCVKQISMPV